MIADSENLALPKGEDNPAQEVGPMTRAIWRRRSEAAPIELEEIIKYKTNLAATSTAFKGPLEEWYKRHLSTIGSGEPILLTVGSGAITARLGSVGPQYERVFFLPTGIPDREIALSVERTLNEKPQVKTVMTFKADASGSYRVEAWGIRGEDPLPVLLREDGLVFASAPVVASVTSPAPTSSVAPAGIEPPVMQIDWAAVKVEDVLNIAQLSGVRETIVQALSALRTGQNVILIGPPGSGKTTLAEAIFKAANAAYDLRCASDHWTTFETIGGYFPEPTANGSTLTFQPGAIIGSVQKNKCVVIDEINRADIDKAFGELFTVFGSKAATAISLPLQVLNKAGEKRNLVLAKANPGSGELPLIEIDEEAITIPKDWRIIGAMNDADRASLKRISLAFARRFAMVPVPLPAWSDYAEVIRNYATNKGSLLEAGRLSSVVMYLEQLFARQEGLASLGTSLGPGFAKSAIDQAVEELDMDGRRSAEEVIISVIELYISPQFESVASRHNDLIELLKRVLPTLNAGQITRIERTLSGWTGGMVPF